jgi:hypothetical protein
MAKLLNKKNITLGALAAGVYFLFFRKGGAFAGLGLAPKGATWFPKAGYQGAAPNAMPTKMPSVFDRIRTGTGIAPPFRPPTSSPPMLPRPSPFGRHRAWGRR